MSAPVDARRDLGFTLAEIIVSLGLFALIAAGSLVVLGAMHTAGALGATPTAVGAVRLSKDRTAAGVYLQAVQEYLADLTAAQLSPGTYCGGDGCPPHPPLPPQWSGVPLPASGPEQLGRARVVVTIERWYWDGSPAAGRYCAVGSAGCGADAAGEFLTRTASTLTWEFKGAARSMTLVRFVP